MNDLSLALMQVTDKLIRDHSSGLRYAEPHEEFKYLKLVLARI